MTLQWSSNVGAPHTSQGSAWSGVGFGDTFVAVSAIYGSEGGGRT